MLGKRKPSDDGNHAKRQKTYDFLDIEPFDMFVTSPPIVYYSNYCKLTSYVTSLHKSDGNTNLPAFEIGDLPSSILSELGLLEDATQCWRAIIDLLTNCDDPNDIWDRIGDVDSILCLVDEPESSCLVTEGQLELWWIKQVQTWFSSNPAKTDFHNSYLKTGMNALVLEAFYRLVWGRFTYQVFREQQKHATPSQDMDVDVPVSKDIDGVIDANDMGLSDDENDGEENDNETHRSGDTEMFYVDSEGYATLPNVVDLFFCQNEISKAFDSVEGSYFDQMNSCEMGNTYWDIKPVVDSFIELCEHQSQDQQGFSNPIPQTKKAIFASIVQMYLKKHVPFLRKLGIFVNPESPFQWKWAKDMDMQFVDEVYVTMFRHLTENGQVGRSQQLLKLFPEVMMKADSSAHAQIPRICDSVEELITKHHPNIPEVKEVIQLLTGLVEEKKTLERTISSNSASTHSLIQESRQRRIQELTAMIDSLQREFHELTGSIDLVMPQRKIRISKPQVPKKSKSTRSTGEFSSEFVVSFDTVIKMLSMAGISDTCSILSLGTLDCCIPLAARCFFRANVISYGCSNTEKKVVSNRISSALQHYKNLIEETLQKVITTHHDSDSRISQATDSIALTFHETLGIAVDKETVQTSLTKYWSNSQKKTQKEAFKKMYSSVYESLQSDFFPIHSNTIQGIKETIEALSFVGERKILVALSASTLWDIWFKESHGDIKTIILRWMDEYPSVVRILVVNKINPREYAHDIWKYIPWNMEAHGRLLEYNTFTMTNSPNDSPIQYSDMFDWFYDLLSRSGNQEEKRFLKSYRNSVRDFTLFYPPRRTPILPNHFSICSLHVMPPRYENLDQGEDTEDIITDEDTKTQLWNFTYKQAISTKTNTPGTTITAIWDLANSKAFELFPDIVFRKKKLWESLIYNNLVLLPKSAKECTDWLLHEISHGVFRELIRYEGIFVISDHPGKCTMISSKSYADNIRFYTVDQTLALENATAELPNEALLFSNELDWQTVRMSIPGEASLYCNDRIVVRHVEQTLPPLERLWKYCIIGNSEFWRIIRETSVRNLNVMRSLIESQFLGGDIDDIVGDTQIGPLHVDLLQSEIATDILQTSKQSRLISPLEEWIFKQKPNIIQSMKELCVVSMMNISLVDSSNWNYWDKRYNLQQKENFSQFTAPDSLPPSHYQNISKISTLCSTIENLSPL